MLYITEKKSFIETFSNDYDENLSYRFTKYCITEKIDNGCLLYHTVFNTLLFFSDQEIKNDFPNIENIEIRNILVKNFFYIPENFNEVKTYNQIFDSLKLFSIDEPNTYSSYLIMTTSNCNARCFYCCQHGITYCDMSETTALQIAKFIVDHAGDKKISIEWYGGEPLYNFKIIDIVSKYLKENNKTYSSKMITNLSLFNKEMLNHAEENDWNLKSLQVTLDGFGETYDKIKNYKDKDITFFTIIDNLKLVLDAGIVAKVRVCLDDNNIESLKQLVNFLAEKFGKYKNIYLYIAMLFDTETKINRTEKIFNQYLDINEYIFKKGLNRSILSKKLKLNNCMADNNSHLYITHTGEIAKCGLDYEKKTVGSIFNGVDNQVIISEWKEKIVEPFCVDCKFRFMCNWLKNCPNHRKNCNSKFKETKEQELRFKMINTYMRNSGEEI